MYYRFLVIFVLLIVGCTSNSNTDLKTSEDPSDSISFYDKKAQNLEYSLEERKHFANKAFEKAHSELNTKRFARLSYQKNYLHLSLGEYDSLLVYDRQMNRTRFMNAPAILAMQEYLMGYYFEAIIQQPDSAFVRYNRSKFYYQKVSDSNGIGKALLNMGAIQKRQNDFFGSKETLTEALKYIDQGKNAQTYFSTLDRLAQNHRRLKNLQEAEALYDQILQGAPREDLPTYKNNLATLYIDQQEYTKALTLLNDIPVETFEDSNTLKARILDNTAYAMWSSKIETPLEAFLIPLELRKKANDHTGSMASYTHLGEFFMTRQPQRATAYFDSVIRISRKLNVPRAELDVLHFKMKLDPENLRYKDRYIALRDSLYESELKVKTQFAKYKYDDQLKQEALLNLEKQNVENELKLAEERYTKLWIIAALVVAILLSVLIYFNQKYRAKRLKDAHRIDRLKATYDTEAAISRRLHDDFGSGLNNVMLMLQRNAGNEQVLDRLEGLYDQSRDFSRTLNEIDTGAGYSQILSGMLREQTPEKTNLLLLGYQQVNWGRLNAVSKITLYKVLRELMINMRKHSAAQRVTLKFSNMSQQLEVIYTDNGRGASSTDLQLRNGLQITEKRILAIGGTLTFETAPGTGFKAVIKLPY